MCSEKNQKRKSLPKTRKWKTNPRRKLLNREAFFGYLFLFPSMTILLIFVFWPIFQAILLSLQDFQFFANRIDWVGLENYQRLINDDRFWNALKNTIIYTIAYVPITVIFALALALALNQKIPKRNLLRGAFFLPVIGSFAIVSIIWKFLLDPDIGLIAYWFSFLNISTHGFLRDPNWAMFGVIIVSIWKGLGFLMVIYLAGLQGIPEVYYEAAKVDGATAWQRFWYITLPQLRFTTLFVLVISVIGAFQVFDVVWVLTPGGGPLFSTDVLVTYIFYQGITNLDISYASTIGIALLIIVLILTLLQLRILQFSDNN